MCGPCRLTRSGFSRWYLTRWAALLTLCPHVAEPRDHSDVPSELSRIPGLNEQLSQICLNILVSARRCARLETMLHCLPR